MNSFELRDLFRIDVDDTVLPYMWSDDEIIGYADDAQKMFCRLTQGLRDATSQMCFLDMEPHEAYVKTDPRILRILRIQRDSDSSPLEILNIDDLDNRGIKLDNTEGAVWKAIIGMEAHTLRWLRVPLEPGTASMIVERLPLNTLTSARSLPLEIDSQHHRHLMLWMASLAYAKQDADTVDKTKAADKEAKFIAYCQLALRDKLTAKHKTRVVRYGGL